MKTKEQAQPARANTIKKRLKFYAGFFIGAWIVLFPLLVLAAEAKVRMQAKIISFEDTKEMCGSKWPPAWCPPHLLNDIEPAGREQYEICLDQTGDDQYCRDLEYFEPRIFE